MTAETPVYLELGKKRVFACALDWPGWYRSGKTEDEAIARLAEYAPRYAVVAEAGVRFPRTVGSLAPPVQDAEPASAAEAKRIVALVAASWRVLDEAASRAPAELAKGASRRRARSGQGRAARARGGVELWAGHRCAAWGAPQPSPGTGRGGEVRGDRGDARGVAAGTHCSTGCAAGSRRRRGSRGHLGTWRGGWRGMCWTMRGRSRTRAGWSFGGAGRLLASTRWRAEGGAR